MNQTDLEWIQLGPSNLQYVSQQTEELCLMAIQKDPNCLQYVKNQTLNICLTAINRNPKAAKHIRFEELSQEDSEYLRLLIL